MTLAFLAGKYLFFLDFVSQSIQVGPDALALAFVTSQD